MITTVRDPIDADVLEAGKNTLLVVGQDAVGVDNIDLEAASRLGIPVTHTPDVLTDATAEFALFMMGNVARRLYSSERLVREGRWTLWHPSRPFLGDEVSDKTVGIIGLGRIGKSFAAKCSALEMDILAFTRTPDEDFGHALQASLDQRFESGLSHRRSSFRFASFRECLIGSDFLSLHVPLLPETRSLIDSKALSLMKESAYLINTSRGPVVDEDALYDALKAEEIAGAALDVYSREPLPASSPLLDSELDGRLRLFHHLGSGTYETRLSPDPNIGMAGRCVQGVLDVLEGRHDGDPLKMPFVVNKDGLARFSDRRRQS